MDADRFRKAFLLLLVVFISVLFVSVIRHFLMTILLSAIFSGLMHPLYKRFSRLFGDRRSLASLVTVLVFLVAIVAPVLTMLGMVVGEAVEIGSTVVPWVQKQIADPTDLEKRIQDLPLVEKLMPYRESILRRAGEMVGKTSQFLVGMLSSATRGTAAFFFFLFLFLYAMFFFLKDGSRMLEKFLYYMPLDHDDEVRMLDKFVSVTRATLKGTLIIGVVQGGLAGIALGLAGVGGVMFWTAVMIVLSVIPAVGVSLVWIPAVVYLGATGHVLAAILVTLWCALVVGTADNFLRPRLVGKDTKMNDLLVLFSTLGGLMLFGFSGFILGPVIAALFVTIWDIYGVVFADVLPGAGPVGEQTETPTSDDSP